ncbi:MAG: extracellular solute-binding protein [Clostridia bacterium]|nr:extracellular solute-binding protein [Clostridia bacterium]
MKPTKFQRVTALLLSVLVLLGCGAVATSAAQSSTGTTSGELSAMLNALSYTEYQATSDFANAAKATESIVLLGTDGTYYDTNGNPVAVDGSYDAENNETKSLPLYFEADGVSGLYIPNSGKVEWILDSVETATKYSLEIDYYPVVNKSADIERVLYVNGSIPFAEARQLSLSKIWKNNYHSGSIALKEGEDAQALIDSAKLMNISCTLRYDETSGVSYIDYTMPDYWTEINVNHLSDLALRFFKTDVDKNEIRESLVQSPSWCTYQFKDSNGFLQETFEVVLTPDENGKVTLALESVNEPVAISEIRLVPHEGYLSYADYRSQYSTFPGGSGVIKMEAEYYSASNTQTIYPISDTTSAASSPAATDRTVLNTIGGEKWQNAGQWVEYRFQVAQSGNYAIATRFKQSVLDGMYASRALYLYSDGLSEGSRGYYNGIPFEEASRLKFNYSSDWQSGYLTDGVNQFEFYFEAGVVYTMRLEVTLGSMGTLVGRVQNALESINADYLNILKLTGPDPDEYRDYGFSRIMPNTMTDMILQAIELNEIARLLAEEANVKSSMTATLEKIARCLDEMGRDDDAVAKNLEQLKTHIGSLGTWLSDAKTQPLALDYICVQPTDEALPKGEAGFFEGIWFEIKGFFYSFFRKYDRMGAMQEIDEDETIEVWLAYGRDQAQVIRSLINDDFSSNTAIGGAPVNLKLVAGSTLLPSILSGMGPDVFIGLGQGDVINYAIRGALIPIEELEGYGEIRQEFNDAAMIALEIEDSAGVMHSYGLPETQAFNMMFVREDILAELGLDIPETWDDVKAAIPVLQANNMQIGMHNDVNIFLYQMDGELFADGGMRINLDSNVALEAFDTMCGMFTENSFPYKYDFANRFRTGEMPIGFAAYAGTYNQLKVFATEIEGLWNFYPMPGYRDEMTGELNRVSVSTVSAIVMINSCKNIETSWNFMKWHAGDECQVDYSNEMVAILGPSAKHSTANILALESLPWTNEEYLSLAEQFNSLAAIPNYPGRYIIDRYTKFAFLAAYDDNANPITELLSYIDIINEEITRKRSEFDLETLEPGQTLAQKRMKQAVEALDAAKENSSYKSEYETVYKNAIKLIMGVENDVKDDYQTDDYASLRALANDLEKLNSTLFAEAVEDMRQAADALQSYEAYQ